MSLFKRLVSLDTKRVFINKDEFAEEHNLNGSNVVCVVDKNIIEDAKQLGVFINAITIYVETADLNVPPVEGELLEFDGNIFVVRSVSDEDSMLVIVAEANEQ
jgi:hypothetical protein